MLNFYFFDIPKQNKFMGNKKIYIVTPYHNARTGTSRTGPIDKAPSLIHIVVS